MPSTFGPDPERFLEANINTTLDVFFKLFSVELADEIIFQTTLYAEQRGRPYNFTATREELFTFLGILILSGYYPVPYRRLYWSND